MKQTVAIFHYLLLPPIEGSKLGFASLSNVQL